MKSALKKYICGFLERYKISSESIESIDFEGVNNFDSMRRQLKLNDIYFPALHGHLQVIFDLYEKGIYVYKANYKKSNEYLLEKDAWICINENVRISTENYIERFLLNEDELNAAVYKNKSIYAMGNPYEIEDEECELAEVLMTESELPTTDDPDDYTSEMRAACCILIKKLRRPCELELSRGKSLYDKQGELNPTPGEQYQRSGGLLDRLKIGLNLDIRLFDIEKEYEAEICKIIYFFYELERTPIIPGLQGKQDEQGKEKLSFNLINFLSQPSMESVDYSFFGWETYNGKITRFIKNKLEKEMLLKEMLLKEIANIRGALDYVAATWDKLLNDARKAIKTDRKIDLDQRNHVLDSMIDRPRLVMGKWATWDDVSHHTIKEDELESVLGNRGNTYQASPIATLYLKVCQSERLGEAKDKMWVNDIEIEADYDVPQEFVDRMKLLENEPIGVGGVEEYIDENITEIAEFVYPELKAAEEEYQSMLESILASKRDVSKVLDCCVRAGSLITSETEGTRLLVISCLQAILIDQDILTDKKSDDDGYTFYDYQYHFKANRKLKNDKYTVEAIKFYWARKVEEHWYANLGKYKLIRQFREFEGICYKVLMKIYSCPNVSEMKSRSEDYYGKLKQISAAI